MSIIKRVSFSDTFTSEITPAELVIGASSFLVGSGVPLSSLGNDADVYLDSVTGNLYLKASGAWAVDSQLSLPASQIINTPSGTVSATDVQSAINELELEKLNTSGGTISGNLIVSGDLQVDGTTVTLNTATLDVEDANITINNGGTQATADSADAGLTVEMSDATDAIIGYDSTLASKFKIGELGSEKEIIDTSSTQDVSNKAIKTPSQLDVKSDTDANLVTYALTTSNGQLVFATDTKIMYQVKDNLLVELGSGSGGGGLDTFISESFETTVAADLTTGQNATFDNGGVFGGVLSDETTTPISGDSSLKYTTHATIGSSNNDFHYLSTHTLDDKQKGQDIGINLYYNSSIANDLMEVVIWDDTNNVKLNSSLDLLKLSSNNQRYSTSVFIPLTCDTIKVGFHHVGVSESSKVLIVDDIELSTNPFVYKNLSVMESGRWDTRTGYGSTNTKIPYFTNERENTFSKILTATNSSVNGLQFTAKRRCLVTVFHNNSENNGIGHRSGITKNISGAITAAVLSYVNTDNLIGVTQHYDGAAAVHVPVTVSFILEEGDVIQPHTTGSTYVPANHYLVITAQAQEEHVITPATVNFESYRSDGITGHGSTNTKIPYMANERENTISELGTIDNSSTLGWSFTADRECIATLNLSAFSDNNQPIGISLNSTTLTTTISSVAVAERVAYSWPNPNTSDTSTAGHAGVTIRLNVGDVLRPHTNGENIDITRWVLNLSVTPTKAKLLASTPIQKVTYIKDVKATNVSGGGFTAAAWQTRVLNTITGNTDNVSIASNQITIQKGLYKFHSEAPARSVDGHRSILYDITNSSNAILGSSNNANATNNVQNTSIIEGEIEILEPTVYEVRHYCQTTKATDGFGQGSASTGGLDEIYTQVTITKLR